MSCRHKYEQNDHCGATVCVKCDSHQGFARCFCGWSATDGGNGYYEMLEMGEQIEPIDE